MKTNNYLAQKYAKAFDSCAKNLQEAKQNLLCYQRALKNIAQIKDIIDNPAILAKDIGSDFVCLLIRAGRFALAPSIEQELLLLLDKRQGLIRAQITTATALNAEEQKEVQKVLKDFFKKDIALSFKEDKNILGGMIVKQEDLCIDGSILGQLENLKQTLKR